MTAKYLTDEEINSFPAWELMPELELGPDAGTSLTRCKHFFVGHKSSHKMDYCIDYSGDTVQIEVWRNRWVPHLKGFTDVGEALQTLAILLATDAIKP